MQVLPGRGVGFLSLGTSLHDILTRLKAQPQIYPNIDLSYWPSDPFGRPLVLNLPANGLRLRFDGPDQRLRLIEILDFSKTSFTYDGKDIVKLPESRNSTFGLGAVPGPTFRYVYDKLLGPSFPGQYVPPDKDSTHETGSYVLSYPGIAFSFPLPEAAWRPEENFVILLSSAAAGPASSIAIFSGASWQDACQDLYTRDLPNPKMHSSAGRGKEQHLDEIELVHISCDGNLKLLRRSSAHFDLKLGETTPQDLVAELGPPSAIYIKSDRRLSIHKALNQNLNLSPLESGGELTKYDENLEIDRASSQATTDSEDESLSGGKSLRNNSEPVEYFYNYFHHGLDIFIADASWSSSAELGLQKIDRQRASKGAHGLVVTKVLLHGNIPGSYPFNRYCRTRWIIDPNIADFVGIQLDSETPFTEIANTLQQVWQDSEENGLNPRVFLRGMPINREWDSPGSSCELLGGWEEQTEEVPKKSTSKKNLGHASTELFGYPGLIFEVLKSGIVSCLTVY